MVREQEIKIQISENDQADGTGKSKGFVNHRIDLFLGEKRIGYIKLTHLKSESFYQLFPTVWDYMASWQGWVSLKGITDRDLLIKEIARYKGFWEGDFNKLSAGKKAQLYKVWEQECLTKQNKSLDFFLDKPFVCFVEVNQEYRGQGFGKRLYLEAYNFCKEKGLPLYSDDNQTKEAVQLWESFVKAGSAEPIGKRYQLKFVN